RPACWPVASSGRSSPTCSRRSGPASSATSASRPSPPSGRRSSSSPRSSWCHSSNTSRAGRAGGAHSGPISASSPSWPRWPRSPAPSTFWVPCRQTVRGGTGRGRSLRSARGVAAVVAARATVAGTGYVWIALDSDIFGGNPVYLAVMALVVAGYAVLFSAKGVLAGNRRFADVGWVLMLEGVIRLAVGLLLVVVVVDAASYAWGMAAAPLAALVMRFWRHDRETREV